MSKFHIQFAVQATGPDQWGKEIARGQGDDAESILRSAMDNWSDDIYGAISRFAMENMTSPEHIMGCIEQGIEAVTKGNEDVSTWVVAEATEGDAKTSVIFNLVTHDVYENKLKPVEDELLSV